jgi:hypothetical protein
MPMHDWTRVKAGIFHDFHNAWIIALRNALNGGLLPSDFYARTEQVAGDAIPDVLALRIGDTNGAVASAEESNGGSTAVVAAPRVRHTAEVEADLLAMRQKRLAIRHNSDDEVVAYVEIVSPGNKDRRLTLRQFVEKAVAALGHGCHLLVLDPQPPGRFDPQGIHSAIWEELGGTPYTAPPDKPLTLAAYAAGVTMRAYVEPIALGDVLIDMPLFFKPGVYVPVPLERTYSEAWTGMPQRWKTVLGK